ncbi:Transcription factor SPT20 -like protein-like 1 [Sarcoptes scabiei]|uniref:Transcription factor SPT20 -like protein-like 1 n=1 Tax=Sarcoptes scabiei TaxID=52283 RepID=A0A834RKL5_SARSC|nr:Transcription factor SPT20 -like protein-like 1 [Sarcoptes scabiei]
MSTIIFDRMMNREDRDDFCENEEEIDEENYSLSNCDVRSKSYLVNLYRDLKNCNYFLNSLIKNEQLDYIVISLFKNHHYSVGIKIFDSEFVSTDTTFTCDDNEIINYIDNEELPPRLINMIDIVGFKNIYYNGCIVSEIRDYRQSSTEYYNSSFILLKPTSLSLFNDLEKLIAFSPPNFVWTNKARLKLESKLIYLTSPKLCLDPYPCIGILSKKLSRKKLIFSNKLFLKLPRKRLKNMFADKKLNNFPLLKFLDSRKISIASDVLKHQINVKNSTNSFSETISESSDHNLIDSSHYEYQDVSQLAEKVLRNHLEKLSSEDNPSNEDSLIKTEEYLLEFLETPATFTKLIIFKRKFDDCYFGNISHSRNGELKGPPNFHLGANEMKCRYVDQFLETFSENGRKLIRITHKVGNEEPKYRLTQAVEYYFMRKQNSIPLNKTTVLEREEKSQKSEIESKTEHKNPINKKKSAKKIKNLNNQSVLNTALTNHQFSSPTITRSISNSKPNSEIILLNTVNNNQQVNNKEAKNSEGQISNSIKTTATITASKTIPATSSNTSGCQLINLIANNPQNGTQQIPIQIPISLSLQQLKSGQFTLISDQANLKNHISNTNELQNSGLHFNNRNLLISLNPILNNDSSNKILKQQEKDQKPSVIRIDPNLILSENKQSFSDHITNNHHNHVTKNLNQNSSGSTLVDKKMNTG